ncbi:D-alanine--D-alanine ligase family protein [Amycolatopsis pithecellobii]|uniref:D-alanine--D-alanine ligase n=1 Tax=Amycolatopsis pithecellobii TaxID=664692 RepID=A0A6N7YUP7_9PSEU|nr:D-alanine--D-alanine ligase family protein [Amycolatopsis pithecellobii]MTD52583.1 D-alanine--D-alanine ligase [Amycolatopsis pithecellobii]
MTATGKLRVAIFVGGRTAEHSNSIDSGDFVRSSLREAGYEVSVIGISRSGKWLRQADDVPLEFDEGRSEIVTGTPMSVDELDADVAFPVLHGPYGEDGTVQGLLEMIDMPYVGCGVFASAAAKDKVWANRLLEAAGLPVAPWRVLAPGRTPKPIEEFTPPVFVKPARCGGSLGVCIAHTWDELESAVAEARRFDPKVIIEQGMSIRDVECGVLEFAGKDAPVASVAGETIAGTEHEFLSYEAKFFDSSVQLLAPAPLDDALTEKVRTMAVDAFLALGCTGLSRVDMFVTGENSVLVNEVTTMPGFSRVSNFAKMWRASGLEAPDLVDGLVRLALARKAESDLPL